MRSQHYQSGMSMIEVLVSMVITSVGILGLAKLEISSKQNNFQSVERITAAYLAKDMISRMRANPTGLINYVTNTGSNTLGRGSITTEPTPTCADAANACSQVELGERDLWLWERALDGQMELLLNDAGDADDVATGGLVSPTACLTGPADGSAGVYTVAIAWRGSIALSNPTSHTCGQTTGLYGANNEYRRLLTVVTFIDNI